MLQSCDVHALNRNVAAKVVECFSYLKPFSLSRRAVMFEEDGGLKIVFVEKDFSTVDGKVDLFGFLNLVRGKGEVLAECVRSQVRDAFVVLCRLSRRVRLYKPVVLRRRFSGDCSSIKCSRAKFLVSQSFGVLERVRVSEIVFSSDNVRLLHLVSDGTLYSLVVSSAVDLSRLFNVVSSAADVLAEFLETVSRAYDGVRRWNDGVFERMLDTVRPHVLAADLGR